METKYTYEIIECKKYGFSEFFAYCEVNNLHFDNIPLFNGPVMFAELAHGAYGIYNSHTSTGYVLNGSKEWAKKQFKRCCNKYCHVNKLINNNLANELRSHFYEELKTLREYND